MSIIKIGVACHKTSELPANDLFLPIQVGAALSSKNLGIQRDDEGDNISIKNKQYCELTAQYWLWKNVEADYYGLCHYRRFLCFSGSDFKKDERNQINAAIIDEESKKLYELENSELMRREIESNDIIVGDLQDLGTLYTPRIRKDHKKNTVYEHWTAHHRDLIIKNDLDEMLRILDDVSPEIGKHTREYLKGYKFLGFNCFIARKDIFNELCELEFRVLSELEKQVNLNRYNSTLSRIYGFMGEIISSAFFDYLEKKGIYKIKHVPLVFFNFTDKLPVIEPYASEKVNTIPVCFNIADTYPEKFGTIWQSFLDHIDPHYFYDVILAVDTLPKRLIKIYREMAEKHSNVQLRMIETGVYRTKYGKKYEFIPTLRTNYQSEDYLFSILPFLPLILSKYDRMVVVDENILFCDSIADLWEKHKNDQSLISAAHNTYMQGLINDVFYETIEEQLSKVMKDPLQFFSCNLLVWNFEKYRNTFTEEEIAEKYLNSEEMIRNSKAIFGKKPESEETIRKNKAIAEKILLREKKIRNKEKILNVLCEGQVTFIDTRWATWVESNSWINNQINRCPVKQFEQLLIARKDPGAIVYLDDDPWIMTENELYYRFWPTAKKMELLYPLYLNRAAAIQRLSSLALKGHDSLIDEIYSSYSYRVGNFLIQPFHWGKELAKKIIKWIK